MRTRKPAFALLVLWLGLVCCGRAAPKSDDARWDHRFAVPGAQGNVLAMAFDKNRIYLGGQMDSVGRAVTEAVAEGQGGQWRALPDGPQTHFPFFDGVLALAVFQDRLYAGGLFTNVAGLPAGGLACWDGRHWSAPVGIQGRVYLLHAAKSGLLVGGEFTLPDSTNRVTLARWDGRGWEVLSGDAAPCAAPATCPESVSSLETLGEDLIAGVLWKGVPYYANSGLGRLDKHRRWSVFPKPTGETMVWEEYHLTKFRGQLVTGGEFAHPTNAALRNVALWDGAGWQPLGEGLPGYVLDVAGNDRRLYALHEVPSSDTRRHTIVSAWDGASWSALGTNFFRSPENPFRLFLGPDGAVYVTGLFAGPLPLAAPGVVRWDGRRWESLFDGAYEGIAGGIGTVMAFTLHQGEVFIGGSFLTAGDAYSPCLARWTGKEWRDVGGSVSEPSGRTVRTLASSGPRLFAGGTFTYIGDVAATNVASWDGSRWEPLGGGISRSVSGLAWWQDSLYACGTFDQAGGVAATNVARWDGTRWHPLGAGCRGTVSALAVWCDQLYVAGTITQAGPVKVLRLARWDGAQWHDVGGGVSATGRVSVTELAAGADGLYVAGTFTHAGGIAAANIARWDGTNWHALGEGWPGNVNSLAVWGHVAYVGGRLTNSAGQIEHLRRWDGRAWSPLGSGVEDPRGGNFGRPMALLATGDDLWVGGLFAWAGGKPSAGVARWVERPRVRLEFARDESDHRPRHQVMADDGLRWRWEGSTDLRVWTPLPPGEAPGLETTAPRQFFRAVLTP